MKKSLYIFDLDGTLLDTSPGIIHCYHLVADFFNKPRLSPAAFANGVIGGPLRKNLQAFYELTNEEAEQVVTLYREAYARYGIKMAAHYQGIAQLLKKIRLAGAQTAVATMKREDLAQQILMDFRLAQNLDAIYGVDDSDSRTKADLVGLCLQHFSAPVDQSVLVGDSIHDAEGAKKIGVDCIGVGYGFGFQNQQQAKQAGCVAFAPDVSALDSLVLGMLGD